MIKDNDLNEPLKVMMIAPTSFFGDYGGHIRIYEETLALQRLGHRVTIVTYYKGRDLPGIDIRRTAPLPYRTQYEVGSSRHKLAFDLFLAWTALRVALTLRPDVIHGHMHEGALIGRVIAWLLRVPLVFDFQGSLSGEMVDHNFLRRGSVLYRAVHALERWICRRSPAILTSSSRARALLIDEFDVTPATIWPLPDCVDVARFDPQRVDPDALAALRARWNIPADRQVVTYLGLLADYQGTSDLVEAARLLKAQGRPAHFLIMGYPNVDRYLRQAATLGVHDYVTFTGKVQYDDAPLYLSLGDLSVSPKTSATEGSGKVLNYMALGQPIVAYDTPVHREYLGDLGVYAPPGDVPALAAAIADLLADHARRATLGAQLRARAAAHFNWTIAADRIVTTYATLRAKA